LNFSLAEDKTVIFYLVSKKKCSKIYLRNFPAKREEDMIKGDSKKLLQDKRVIEEINRHKWIESEKAGHDIGFEKAAAEWITRYADDWESHFEKQKEKKFSKLLRGKVER
jgi:hypothetical protein